MKIAIGNTPINSLYIHSYEMNTNDATLQASDLQSGITAYARGKKVTGSGKSFEFAFYGQLNSNASLVIPIDTINIVHISSLNYPVYSTVKLGDMKNLDFSISQTIGNLVSENSQSPVSVLVQNNEIFISCDVDTTFEIFFGKDNYV